MQQKLTNLKLQQKKLNVLEKAYYQKTKLDEEIEPNDFIRIISYAIRYDKENKTDVCNKNEFKKKQLMKN